MPRHIVKTMGVLFAFGCLLLTAANPAADEIKPQPKRHSLRSYGEKAQVALEAFAADLGYAVELPNESDDTGGSIEDPCWFAFTDVSTADAESVLSIAFALHVVVDHAKRRVSAHCNMGSANRTVKGYEVSVLASRYVEYVNKYGAKKAAPPAGQEAPKEQTACEHLNELIDDLLARQRWGDTGSFCVGKRLLMNLTPAQHEEVRELMNILMSEKGGPSAAVEVERKLTGKLGSAVSEEEFNERPLGSAVAALFSKAGAGFVVAHSSAGCFSDTHVSRSRKEGESVAAVLEGLAMQNDLVWDVNSGVVRLAQRDAMITLEPCGYRVFELKELLARLASEYVGQQTQPGLKDGFVGDLRSMGGMDVVREALERQSESSHLDFRLNCYGTRLIVSGSAQTIDATGAILKELGWEEPKED